MPHNLPSPLGGPAPPEVPLPNTPLVRVLAAVQLPGILKIGTKEEAGRFQEEVRRQYPIFEQEPMSEVRFELGTNPQLLQQNSSMIWRFIDPSKQWRVALTPASVSLEAITYTSRADFLSRLSYILEVTQRLFEPQIAQRLGVRYLDQLKDESFSRAHELIRPDMVGMTGAQTRQQVVHAISEAALKAEEGDVLVRWGILPPSVVLDPGLMAPTAAPTWVLDIDASFSGQVPFEHAELTRRFEALSQRAYAVFRYVVNDEFLRFFGGEL